MLPATAPARTLGASSRDGPQRVRPELHVVRASELLLREVDLERRRQLLAVPGEATEELLVVRAALVPVREQRGGDVDPLAVPALRDHVDLLPGDLLVGLLRRLWIREIEVARLAVHERVDPESLAVAGDADVDRQRNLRRVADRRDLLRLPLALAVLPDEPELGRQRGGGDRPVVLRVQRPADLERRARYTQD